MTAIIKTEFQKMKRYHILLIALRKSTGRNRPVFTGNENE